MITKEQVQKAARHMDMLELSDSQINWVIQSYEDHNRQGAQINVDTVIDVHLNMLKQFLDQTSFIE